MPALGTWIWEVSNASGTEPDRVELDLHLFGKEVVRLNGKLHSSRRTYGTKSSYQLELPSGRQALLHIGLSPTNKTFAPFSVLTVNGVEIAPIRGRVQSKPRPLPAPPPLTPARKTGLIFHELYLNGMLIGFAIYCWSFMHPVGLPQMQSLRFPMAILIGFELFLLFGRFKQRERRTPRFWKPFFESNSNATGQ